VIPYVRYDPTSSDDHKAAIGALAAATATGLVAFYLIRLYLSSDRPAPEPPRQDREGLRSGR